MTQSRINLQNTPDLSGVERRLVSFDSAGVALRGVLYLPKDASASLPAVVVTGAWTTVKEQMAGTYARELAARGFAALAFDFTGWGESGGMPRYVEDPKTKTADIKAAVRFLAALSDVNGERVGGLGICASSGYMASAVADCDEVAKLALVAPWLHTPTMAEEIYGGTESTAKLIEAGRAAEASDEPHVVIAASSDDENALMYQAPYYTETDRGLIEAYDNLFNVASWEPWLTFDALASADRLQTPTLLICSEAAALPAGARMFVDRTRAPVEEIWLDDVNQFDFYDRSDVVKIAADASAKHFGKVS